MKAYTRPCNATLKVDFRKHWAGGKVETLQCCLLAPHPKYKHQNPRLLITMGGLIAKEAGKKWSPYEEKIEE